jgi:molybdenum cofactor cytidylyltransferase
MGDIWAIILAAGESKRMGFPKMLLEFNGRTMIENVIANVTDSRVNHIMVVLGAAREEIIARIGKLNINHCFNESYKNGMLSSVQCGFRNLTFDYKAVLVFQGDQPLITAKAIDTVIDAYLSSDKGLVIPVYKNKRGHPLLIDKKYANEIKNISSSESLHSLSDKFSTDVLEVETSESGILRDFDTYDEYNQAIINLNNYGRDN